MIYTPGPYRAEGGAVKAVSHGRWFTVALVDKKRFTPEGREGTARVLSAAPTMLETLKRIHEAFEQGIDAKSRYAHEVRAALREAGVAL